MPQLYGFLTLLPIPHFFLVLILVLLIIGGTFLVISRRDLSVIEGIGLLLIVWAIPLLGVLAAMTYVRFMAGRHSR